MSRVGRLLVVLIFVGVVFAPAALWIAGMRADQIENRDPAPAPSFTAVGDVLDADRYAEASAWLVDRLPLRPELVRANAWLDLHIFAQSANPAVTVGDDGWLFLTEAVEAVCEPGVGSDEVAARMNRLGGIIAGSGRDVSLLIAPEKDAIYPERVGEVRPLGEDEAADPAEPDAATPQAPQDEAVPGAGAAADGAPAEDEPDPADEVDLAACAQDSRGALRDALETAPPPGYLDAFTLLEDLRDEWDIDVYYPHDTHWTTRATSEVAARIVDGWEPDLWDPDAVTLREEDHTGDLTRLLGLPQELPTQRTFIDRPGVATPQLAGDDRLRPEPAGEIVVESDGDATVLPGRTLIVFDSFFDNAIGMLSPYGEETTYRRWEQLDAQAFAELVRDHDRIVMEASERSYADKFGRDLGGDDATDTLIETLRSD